ncbi:Integrin alpha-4 [Nibea albiflora]|uniref:Integrin alpha-4 n=1 Tax=Nibea albiflora TaxID=240163 RepID=A0ACB7EFY1_NIBAL|nr:Integrin alpha-4 [Nibea albiflora]
MDLKTEKSAPSLNTYIYIACKDGFNELIVTDDLCVFLVSCSLSPIMRPSVNPVCVRCGLVLVQVLVLVQILVLVHHAAGYSLDQEHSLEFSGPSSSMFGYSVLLHRHGAHKWLMVGAPVAKSPHSLSAQSPGAIYRCNITSEHRRCHRMHSEVQTCGKTCESDSDQQWLGVSLSRQPGDNGGHILDLVIMGAPGTSYWTGSVLVFNTSSRGMSLYLDDEAGAVGFESYLGYSVGAGHFLSPDSMEVVFIFTVDNNMLRAVSEVSGKELGSYFGSSVCAVDLNNDGLSDLLVGAPMATGVTREEGRVYVYINQGQAELLEAQFELTGSDAYAARFGETIANLGDLDDDGYPDVAIGAPQEDDLKGAVYIYNGRKEGISSTPSQRITGSTLGRDLRMFGQSLSSSIDIDDNGYQDVAVGAFLSDSAVVLRTRPVIQVKASLTLPEHIDQQLALCHENKNPTVCFNITVCFSVRSKHFRGAIELQYNLTSDLLHKPSFPHRFYFHGNGSSNSTRGRVKARHGQLTCTTHVAYQRKDVRDIFTPVQFEVSYSHRETTPHRHASKTFPPLKPILQQSAGHTNTIANQTWFARRCSLPGCSTNMELSAKLVLPNQQQYFPLGSGQTIMLKTVLLNSGDDAFLPRLTLRFPNNIYYIKVLNNLNISFLLDVSQNSTPGDIMIHVNTSSDNYEREEYLHDNAVLNYGPSSSLDTVVEIMLPKILAPYQHRLLKVIDWQFCGGDELCERLVCRLGNLEVGKETTIQLEIRLNPAVLLQAPGRQGIMRMESIAKMLNSQGSDTVLIHGQPVAQVVVEALFTQKPSTVVKVFIIVISLAVGLLILAALIWCLWKAGFFKRDFQKKKEESRRDSWDYVPKYDKRESTT